MKLSQITIRGVDEPTKKRLMAHATMRGQSLNLYSLELLRKAVGMGNDQKTNGLERFAGIMPLDAATEDALRDQKIPVPDNWDDYGL